MKKTIPLVIALLGALTAGASTEPGWRTELAAAEFDALRVEWENGPVTIEPGHGARLVLELTPFADGLTLIPNEWLDLCRIEPRAGLLLLAFERGGESERLGMRLRVELPRSVDIEVKCGNGDVTVITEAGDLDIELGNGDILVENVNGGIDATLGNGDLELGLPEGYAAEALVTQGNGDSTVRLAPGYAGRLDVELGNGDIVIELAEVPANLGLEAESSLGEVRTNLGGGEARAELLSESFELSGDGPRIQAVLGRGDIEINRVDGD
ncbi:MAG: hypothetical protein GF399_09075 [Candidatus Coatesbacteria bacterium]|nr:hypothetical protein [Candidatus Coatesbacteria bacterium]